MPSRLFYCVAFLLIGLSPLVGCARAVQADNPAVIEATDYQPAFAAAVEVLRDHGFRIARNDYRFGVITTYPKEAPTIAEPWVGDNSTSDQAWRGTLNAERRVVEVNLLPVDGAIAEVHGSDHYALLVVVKVQRRREPARYLTHSAGGYISSQYAAVPTHLRQRGIEADSWETIKRDELYGQRLVEAVLNRLPQPTDRTVTSLTPGTRAGPETTDPAGRSTSPATQP